MTYTRACDTYAFAITVSDSRRVRRLTRCALQVWEFFANGATPFGDGVSNAQIKEGIKNPAYRPQFAAGTPDEIVQVSRDA